MITEQQLKQIAPNCKIGEESAPYAPLLNDPSPPVAYAYALLEASGEFPDATWNV